MTDFCGLGNACIDIISSVNEEFLQRFNLPKGICSYLEDHEAAAIDAALINPDFISGGCAANTAAMVRALGGSAAFMGRVADDEIGRLFMAELKRIEVAYKPDLSAMSGRGSTRVYTFVTPDADRTFASFYGEQESLSPSDLNKQAIQSARFLCLDGYALHSDNNRETFMTAIDWAHEAGNQVAFNPCDISILDQYGPLCADIMAKTDVLICNEGEARHIAGAATTDAAAKEMQKRFARGAITCSAEGALAFDARGITHAPAKKPEAPIRDTNGAGDAFAGGYLYGLSRHFSKESALRLGISCASRIITHTGARPRRDYTDLLDKIQNS